MSQKTTKTKTRSTLPLSDEGTSNDAKAPRKFEARIYFTRHSRATVIFEAESLQEAHNKADDIDPWDVDRWNPWDWEMFVASVKPVKKRRSRA